MIKQMSESKAVIGLNMLTLWKDRGTLEPWIAAAARAARRRHHQAGHRRRLQLRGGRRGADDDHRAAQRRQGRPGSCRPRIRAAAAWPSTPACYPRCRCRRSFSRFSCSPLGGNSAWRPRSRIPSREEPQARLEKEHERHEHDMQANADDARPRPDLRHDPARRRAVAGDLPEQAGKARDRPAARRGWAST